MAATYFSRRNLDFTLFEVLDAASLTQYPYYEAHDAETFQMALDTATEIGEKIMRPAYVDSDRQTPPLENGEVKVHPAVGAYYKALSETGLLSASFPFEWGGQQLPKTLYAAIGFITGGAHNSLIMYADLSIGAAKLIRSFGTQEQKDEYLPKLLTGKWTGTMCLTETQAGSSLSDITTTASPRSDSSYAIKGQKIFISAGDHDATENIVHMVLARIDGAPKGTKGISLFIVPKKRLTQEGTLVPNDVHSIGMYHKMGQHATPAMHLEFGAQNDCFGYLVGPPNQGLGLMFQMMNGARLNVGLAGVYVASTAYHAALQYAQERLQGRRVNQKDPLTDPVPIIQHPDIRRLLLAQKAFYEGALCFNLQCHQYLDLEHVSTDPTEKQAYNDLLELLTPVAKTYGAENGFLAVSQAIQVLGGYGYTEDFPLEQLLRDARIFSLYEGTTGIQALAVLGRQIPRNGGRVVDLWLSKVRPDIEAAKAVASLQKEALQLEKVVQHWEKVTQHLLVLAAKDDPEPFIADATLYIEYFGILNVAWQWLRMGAVAQKALSEKQVAGEEAQFYHSKIHTMRFFFAYELPKTQALSERLMADLPLTIFNPDNEILM